MPPKSKTKSASKLPNLANLVKAAAMKRDFPQDQELARLALLLIYETPDDKDHHAVRTKAKLDALRFLHELNMDNRPAETATDKDDEEMVELLKRRGK